MSTLLHQMAVALTLPAQVRLASVDALRGLTVAAMLIVNTPGDWHHVYRAAPPRRLAWLHADRPDFSVLPVRRRHFAHAQSGTAVGRRSVSNRTHSRAFVARAAHHRARPRAARIAGSAVSAEHFRPMGVLQRIGLCVLVSGCLLLYTRPRTQWVIVATVLAGLLAAARLGWDARAVDQPRQSHRCGGPGTPRL